MESAVIDFLFFGTGPARRPVSRRGVACRRPERGHDRLRAVRRGYRLDARAQGNGGAVCRRVPLGPCLCRAFQAEVKAVTGK